MDGCGGRVLTGVGGSGMIDLISVLISSDYPPSPFSYFSSIPNGPRLDIAPVKEVAMLRSYIGIATSGRQIGRAHV